MIFIITRHSKNWLDITDNWVVTEEDINDYQPHPKAVMQNMFTQDGEQEVLAWTIELNTLPQLRKFFEKVGDILIYKRFYAAHVIEILD